MIGHIEIVLGDTAKAGWLLLNGQEVARADYPLLWKWVQQNDLARPGCFGAGDSSTTFRLPDTRRVWVDPDTGKCVAINFQVQHGHDTGSVLGEMMDKIRREVRGE